MRFSGVALCALILTGRVSTAVPALHPSPSSYAVFADSAPQENVASISGTVTTGSGEALVGANVSIKNASGVSQTARTDSKGKYWIGGLAGGTYTISVTAAGFKNFEVASVSLAEGDSIPLNVLMESGPAGQAISPMNPRQAPALPHKLLRPTSPPKRHRRKMPPLNG